MITTRANHWLRIRVRDLRKRNRVERSPVHPAEMPLIKLIGAAIKSAVARDSSKISAFVPQEHQIRMCSDERDNDNDIF